MGASPHSKFLLPCAHCRYVPLFPVLGPMSINPRNSIVFKNAVTFLLYISIAIATGILIFYIIPALDIDIEILSISIGISTLLYPLIAAFAVSFFVAFTIIGWRTWLLYIGPWLRRQNVA